MCSYIASTSVDFFFFVCGCHRFVPDPNFISGIRKSVEMTFNDDFDHINIIKCNRVMGTLNHLKVNKRQLHMIQDLNYGLFYRIGLNPTSLFLFKHKKCLTNLSNKKLTY